MDLDTFVPSLLAYFINLPQAVSYIALVPISLFSKLLCRSLGMTIKMLNKNLISKLTLGLGLLISIGCPRNTIPIDIYESEIKAHVHAKT